MISSHRQTTFFQQARTFGPALVNSFAGAKVWDNSYWIYFIGPFSASIVAAGIYKFIFAQDDDEEEAAAAEAPVDQAPTKEVGGDEEENA